MADERQFHERIDNGHKTIIVVENKVTVLSVMFLCLCGISLYELCALFQFPISTRYHTNLLISCCVLQPFFQKYFYIVFLDDFITSTPANSPLIPLDATICLVVSMIPWGTSLVCMVDFTTSGAMETIQPI